MQDEDELRMFLNGNGDCMDVIITAGYTRPLYNATLQNKNDIINCVTLYHTILKTKAELDQLKSGLSTLVVGYALSKHPNLFTSCFTEIHETQLTSGIICMVAFYHF